MDSGKQKDTFIARMANKVEIIHERELLPILFEFGIVQILYSISWIYLFGIFKGIIVGFAGYYTFYFIMKYFGYEMIGGWDSLSATEIHPHLHRNWTGKLIPYYPLSKPPQMTTIFQNLGWGLRQRVLNFLIFFLENRFFMYDV